MDINEVKDLLVQFDQSSLTEFDLKEGSFELYMNKNQTSLKDVRTSEQGVQFSPVQPPEQVTETLVPVQASVPVAEKTTAPDSVEEILSPLVGVVYLQPAPDKPIFKQVGDKVKKGEVVCIIEAMKLMNEITAAVDGTITEVLVENEDVVEYNQPIFRIAKGE
ncbi:acetyl-CoA carboxylase biotin carboxyl carrier protein [Enterococcus sp. LJL128]